jgi:hypothetical protein
MPFVFSVLKAADYRCSGANELGKLSLREGGCRPQFMDLSGDLFVCSRRFQVL